MVYIETTIKNKDDASEKGVIDSQRGSSCMTFTSNKQPYKLTHASRNNHLCSILTFQHSQLRGCDN